MFNDDLYTPESFLSRRELLRRAGMGFGTIALQAMLAESGISGKFASAADIDSASPLSPKKPHFAPKAKRVIHLFMNGGPSQVDTFDPKPELTKRHGQALPLKLPTERKTGTAFKSPFSFKKYGQSGLEISELFSNLGEVADELCVIRSMTADVPNHEPSFMLMNCGEARQARPCMGSWVLYGLGTENQNLPGFIVMVPGGYPTAETQNWQSAFLPGAFQATYIDTNNQEFEKLIPHIRDKNLGLKARRDQLDLLREINKAHQTRRPGEADLEARIQSFELAYRMQSESEDAFDISREPQHIRDMYGSDVHGRQLLIARRLLERGVRYIQAWHGPGQPWDSHDDLEVEHRKLGKQADKPIAALIKDLKQRGMLDDTLVIWGGEFGRTPVVEMPTPGSNAGKINGRDHNHYGFTMWMAGGGVKRGHVHGKTDEFGFQAVENKVHVHDLHATILHLLGFDHEKLTYRYAGRDFRLTDLHGNVIKGLLA
jgi:hypothetical protein